MKLKDLLEKYGEYEVSETKGDWCDANRITLELKKPKHKTVWDLEKGDNYFVVYNDGDVVEHIWCDTCLGKSFRDHGNVFLTKEEAEKDVERRKVEALLLKHGGRRWFKHGGANWVIYLDKHNQATRCSAERPHQGMIYFDRHGDAVKACEEIGNKRIVNALFEVR